jgi:hypothetical protein
MPAAQAGAPQPMSLALRQKQRRDIAGYLPGCSPGLLRGRILACPSLVN